jgi:hypothetical protein
MAARPHRRGVVLSIGANGEYVASVAAGAPRWPPSFIEASNDWIMRFGTRKTRLKVCLSKLIAYMLTGISTKLEAVADTFYSTRSRGVV